MAQIEIPEFKDPTDVLEIGAWHEGVKAKADADLKLINLLSYLLDCIDGRDATIAELQAELDDARDQPVEA